MDADVLIYGKRHFDFLDGRIILKWMLGNKYFDVAIDGSCTGLLPVQWRAWISATLKLQVLVLSKFNCIDTNN
jgi:hypothetical protein